MPPYLVPHFVSVDHVRYRMNCWSRMFAMTAWKCASFEKHELAVAAPVRWLHDLPKDEITDIYAILKRSKPGCAAGSAIDLAAAVREHHAVGPTTGSKPCQMLRANLSPSRPRLTIALIRHVGVRRRWPRTFRASGTSI
jgi:hypothetical protein